MTTDGWTSITQQSYIATTAHFVGEMETNLQSYLLGCIPYDKSHTISNLGTLLKEEVQSWGLDEKIICVITDNASNDVGTVKYNNWKHVACFAHTLNLVLGDALSVLETQISTVKSIVAYFKKSSKATVKLLAMQKQLNLPDFKLKQDCITRWNSTYEMLSRILRVQSAVRAVLAIENPDLNILSSTEWSILEKAADILNIFHAVTEEMSTEKQITLSKVMLMVNGINRHLKKSHWRINIGRLPNLFKF